MKAKKARLKQLDDKRFKLNENEDFCFTVVTADRLHRSLKATSKAHLQVCRFAKLFSAWFCSFLFLVGTKVIELITQYCFLLLRNTVFYLSSYNRLYKKMYELLQTNIPEIYYTKQCLSNIESVPKML